MMEFLPCRMISACSAALGCWASAAWNRKEWHLRAVWQLRNLFELVFFPTREMKQMKSEFQMEKRWKIISVPASWLLLISTWRVSKRLKRLINVAKRVQGVPGGLKEKIFKECNTNKFKKIARKNNFFEIKRNFQVYEKMCQKKNGRWTGDSSRHGRCVCVYECGVQK